MYWKTATPGAAVMKQGEIQHPKLQARTHNKFCNIFVLLGFSELKTKGTALAHSRRHVHVT